MKTLLVGILLVLGAVEARAERPTVRLKLATIAPEGTSWAREMKGLAQEVSAGTGGHVDIHWYFGGMVGDEMKSIERVQKGQLDGLGGAMLCHRLAPSLRVTKVVGLVQNRDEFHYVLTRLRPRLEQELAANGFVNLGVTAFGSDLLFSRVPLKTLSDWANARLGVWVLDEALQDVLRQMGMHTVAVPVESAAEALGDGRIDAFITAPSAVLAFQLMPRVRYYSMMPIGFAPACVVVASRVFASLSQAEQQILRAAAAKLSARFDDVARRQDEQLTGTLFQQHGLTRIDFDPMMRAEFFDRARNARPKLDPKIIDPELLKQVQAWLADYRAEHP